MIFVFCKHLVGMGRRGPRGICDNLQNLGTSPGVTGNLRFLPTSPAGHASNLQNLPTSPVCPVLTGEGASVILGPAGRCDSIGNDWEECAAPYRE